MKKIISPSTRILSYRSHPSRPYLSINLPHLKNSDNVIIHPRILSTSGVMRCRALSISLTFCVTTIQAVHNNPGHFNIGHNPEYAGRSPSLSSSVSLLSPSQRIYGDWRIMYYSSSSLIGRSIDAVIYHDTPYITVSLHLVSYNVLSWTGLPSQTCEYSSVKNQLTRAYS